MKKNMTPGIVAFIFALMMPWMTGCLTSHSDVTTNDALLSSMKWLTLVDAGNFAESWEASSEALKSRINEATWRQRLHAVREPKGACISRRFIASRYRDYPPGSDKEERLIFRFNTSFQNRIFAVERLALVHDKDGQWRVAAYQITPELPDLQSMLIALLFLVVIVGLWLLELNPRDGSCKERRL